MQLMAWVPPQLQTDVRCRCLAYACAFRAQTRPESLSARMLLDEPMASLPSPRASSGPPRCARPLPFHMITVNTISAERQTLSRNAHALAPGRHLRQGSVGARQRSTMESSSASRTTRNVFLFSLRCLQTFSHSLTSTAGIPISQLRLYRDPLWRLSRYLETPDTVRRLIARIVAPNLARRRSVRGYVSRIRPRRAARLGGRHTTASRC